MDKNGVSEKIRGSSLPADVKQYLLKTVRRDSPCRLKAGLKKTPGPTIGNIERQLEAAAAIIGRTKEEILFITGFNINDSAPERFEAALAEISALIALSEEGFSDLDFMRRDAGRTADISGAVNGKSFVFEVCCVSGVEALTDLDYPAGYAGAAKRGRGNAPAALLTDKFDKKKNQLNSARKKANRDFSCLICVVNQAGSSGPADVGGLAAIVAEWYERSGRPPFTHLCVLSGDCRSVYPPWPAA